MGKVSYYILLFNRNIRFKSYLYFELKYSYSYSWKNKTKLPTNINTKAKKKTFKANLSDKLFNKNRNK